VLHPKSIWYTAVSGIWQTVWLEPVPETYIAGLKIMPDVDTGWVRVSVQLDGPDPGNTLVKVQEAGTTIAQGVTAFAGRDIEILLPNAKLWSPDSPHLYDLVVEAVPTG
jgi:beta-galactosidase/beta-glucuronidase